jgi:hypothetical protein
MAKILDRYLAGPCIESRHDLSYKETLPYFQSPWRALDRATEKICRPLLPHKRQLHNRW